MAALQILEKPWPHSTNRGRTFFLNRAFGAKNYTPNRAFDMLLCVFSLKKRVFGAKKNAMISCPVLCAVFVTRCDLHGSILYTTGTKILFKMRYVFFPTELQVSFYVRSDLGGQPGVRPFIDYTFLTSRFLLQQLDYLNLEQNITEVEPKVAKVGLSQAGLSSGGSWTI